jgi:FtsZ-binding cell division protein ZapB
MLEKAQGIVYQLNNLPDHHQPGADGGWYWALHPKAVTIIALALEAEASARASAEKARLGLIIEVDELYDRTKKAEREVAEITRQRDADPQIGWLLKEIDDLKAESSALAQKAQEAERRSRDHHLEACESCIATESTTIAAVRAIRDFCASRGKHDGPHSEITPPTFASPTVAECALCYVSYMEAEAELDAALRSLPSAPATPETAECFCSEEWRTCPDDWCYQHHQPYATCREKT